MEYVRLGCTTPKISRTGLGAIRDAVHGCGFRRIPDRIPRFRKPWKSIRGQGWPRLR